MGESFIFHKTLFNDISLHMKNIVDFVEITVKRAFIMLL